MEIVLLGHMGRDEALVDQLPEHKVHVLGQWKNPGLVEKAEASGGAFHVIDSITNIELIASYVRAIEPDMFLTNFDDALAAGVVDVIKQQVVDKRIPKLLLPCPDRSAAKIEWDKFYLRKLIEEINPKYNPVTFMAETSEAVAEAIAYFDTEHVEVAVKPRNPTGGKGVKVMGKHFDRFAEAKAYAIQVLADPKQAGVEIQEKLAGHEFTLQLFTDGTTVVKPPATYDYPYREDGDRGPGTGGMGTFSVKDGLLPFVTQHDYDEAIALAGQLLIKLKQRGSDYKGVFYPSFFKTPAGLKIVEVNARGGDPELINILDLAEDDVDFGEVLKLIALGELAEDSVRYKKLASAMVYLVSPEYAYGKGPTHEFTINRTAISDNATKIRFAATENIAHSRYRTVGSSRSVGLSAVGPTPWAARNKIHQAIRYGFGFPLPLAYRNEVAELAYISGLRP